MPHAPSNFFPHLRCKLCLPKTSSSRLPTKHPYFQSVLEETQPATSTPSLSHGTLANSCAKKLVFRPSRFVFTSTSPTDKTTWTHLSYTPSPRMNYLSTHSTISHLVTFSLEGCCKHESWRRRYANVHRSRRKVGRGLGTSLCSRRCTSSPCWHSVESCI